MSIEWVNRAIDGLRAWGHERGVEVDVDEIRLLCDYASDYLEVNELGDFRSGTFEELLLEIYPRKVIAPPETAVETIAAARTLVDFLLDTGEVGTKAAARMRATIDDIEPEMPGALADTTKFGMAKSLFSAIGADALDVPEGDSLGVPDPDVVREAVEAMTGDDACDCPGCAPLPPVRLDPPAEIARAVRDVPLLMDAHAVAEWMAESERTTTARKSLRVRDARLIAQQLDVEKPDLAWRLALDLGLAELVGTAIRLEDGFCPLAERADEDVLDLWAGTVEFLSEAAVEITGDEIVDEELYSLHDLLYRLQTPVPAEALAEYLAEVAGGEPIEDLDMALGALAYAGTVQHTDAGLGLTAHGLWGLREMYLSSGAEAPLAADLSDGDASGLIAGLLNDALAPDAAQRDIDAWLSRRAPWEAATELFEAVAGAPAEVRGMAVSIVDRLDASAESSVRHALDDPELRPHAIHWLLSHGLDAPPLTSDELLWVSVDMLALALPAAEADPEGFAENMAASGPPAHLIEEMWRVDHPDVVEVLELLGSTLPDRAAAKAARKAAFKARSRGIR
ncbi:hypothetical protein J5X84_05385 [Streptosporangiaceae bacterium NEAU-GS5]|nr:hypothetical protein [Streptosporangiaceae bacterium NEAU-GS5]